MKIFNLTQHAATTEQVVEGVVDPSPTERAKIVALLTFRSIPTPEEILTRAKILADLVPPGYGAVMIGGAGFLMSSLETAVRMTGRFPRHAFSERVSTETTDPVTGSVVKTSNFRHIGMVAVP